MRDAFLIEIILIDEFISRVRLVESMPQSAVLTDRLHKLEKHFSEQKLDRNIISPIRDLLRVLRTKL